MVRRLAAVFSFFLIALAWEPNFFMGRRKFGRKILPEIETVPGTSGILGITAMQDFFIQKLDHTNNSNTATWKQRYFFNTQWASGGAINVAFLNLGGEGSENINWVVNDNLPWLQWAKKYQAAVYSLEHRFYGMSYPLENQSIENLKYLTSQQALADAANFITTLKNKEPKLANSKWIVFGGSYSGALALWLRQEYPNIVQGAVGSSAPLQATFDFYQYLDVVEESLGNTAVNGSTDCVEKVKEAFAELITNMNTPLGRINLSTSFNLVPTFDELGDLSYNDIQSFFQTIYGNFQGAVQYSGDNVPPYAKGYGISDVCNMMTSAPSAVEGLIEVNKYMSTMNSGNMTTFIDTPNNYTDMINYLSIEDFKINGDDSFDSGARSWLWQTCTEFGYFQSTDVKETTIFGPVTPVSLFVNICKDVFGEMFTASYISNAVDQTNKRYGGATGYKGTNVVIPNGSLDPWHVLGKLPATESDTTVVPYLINNTAHCADMYSVDSNSITASALNDVHTLIDFNLYRWINSPNSNATVSIIEDVVDTNTNSRSFLRTKRSTNKIAISRSFTVPPEGPTEFQKIHFGRPPHGFKPSPAGDCPTSIDDSFGFVEQLVDHFNKTNISTFKQRFWTNNQWAKKGGPMFLMIGGEGEECSQWVLNPNITYLTWAQQLGATVYLLEHRYYGESKIGMSNEIPMYLSSKQMLYDVADFIKTINYEKDNTSPWIVFGGSYSGALALWMRELFPDLVQGAVGSSGPIQAKLDFFEYLEVVETAILAYNTICYDNIAEAFRQIHALILNGTEGVETVNDLFSLKPKFDNTYTLTEIHKQYFFSNLYSQFQGAVQYSGDNTGPYASSYGIPFMCGIMTNPNQTILNNIKEFNMKMTELYTKQNFTATDNDYEGFIAYLKSGGKNNADAAAKYWTWQTCTEFGYFQSSDLASGIFGSPTPVNLFIDICKKVFDSENLTGPGIQRSVDQTNRKYGGRDGYRGTNVVMPNGSIDPWHALGKFQGTQYSNSSIYIYIDGTAHCADMYPARDSDPDTLKKAREQIGANVKFWVSQGPPPDNNPGGATTTPGGGVKPTQAPTSKPNGNAAATLLALIPVVVSLLL